MPEYHWIKEEIFTITEFLSKAECARLIELAEQAGFDAAPINTMFGPQIRSDVRNNSRMMSDTPELAAHLWNRSAEFVPHTLGERTAVGLNERLRFYRYEIGQQFDWHHDGAFERDSGEKSRLTFMVYLNDDFEGGETAFEDISITPETGKALVFAHPLLHKGQPVVEGTKYVLRTDVMYN